MEKKTFNRLQITFMASYIKIDESRNVSQSMVVPLQSQDRIINPTNIRYLRHILRSCISEADAANILLCEKGKKF